MSKKNKADHFGELPSIPKKVVEVVQLDVVESYGPVDENTLKANGCKGDSP